METMAKREKPKPGPKHWLGPHDKMVPKSFTLRPSQIDKIDRLIKLMRVHTRSDVVQRLIDEAKEDIPKK